MLGKLNKLWITREDVQEVAREMKTGKDESLDGYATQCLKSGGVTFVEWLVKLLNACFRNNMMPTDGASVCAVSFYKDKGDKLEFKFIKCCR